MKGQFCKYLVSVGAAKAMVNDMVANEVKTVGVITNMFKKVKPTSARAIRAINI